eukprot:tig00021108_g18379.t1
MTRTKAPRDGGASTAGKTVARWKKKTRSSKRLTKEQRKSMPASGGIKKPKRWRPEAPLLLAPAVRDLFLGRALDREERRGGLGGRQPEGLCRQVGDDAVPRVGPLELGLRARDIRLEGRVRPRIPDFEKLCRVSQCP